MEEDTKSEKIRSKEEEAHHLQQSISILSSENLSVERYVEVIFYKIVIFQITTSFLC